MKLAFIARALAGERVFDPDSTLVIGGFAFAGVGIGFASQIAAAGPPGGLAP
jgi:hypothetical protein